MNAKILFGAVAAAALLSGAGLYACGARAEQRAASELGAAADDLNPATIGQRLSSYAERALLPFNPLHLART